MDLFNLMGGVVAGVVAILFGVLIFVSGQSSIIGDCKDYRVIQWWGDVYTCELKSDTPGGTG